MKTIVNQRKSKLQKTSLVFGVILLAIIICIAINPSKYSAIAFNGLSVWAKVLVPSLLPFFILTKILLSTGIVDSICLIFTPLTRKVYNCPAQGAYVFFMSIITGYPVGSKLISDLYNSRQITKIDAMKLTSFCSTSGPMFILGTVAIGMFASKKMGYILLISHILGALINGIFYRKINIKNTIKIQNKNNIENKKNKNSLLSKFINNKNQISLKNKAFEEKNDNLIYNKNNSIILKKTYNNDKILNKKINSTKLKNKTIHLYNKTLSMDNNNIPKFHNNKNLVNEYISHNQIDKAKRYDGELSFANNQSNIMLINNKISDNNKILNNKLLDNSKIYINNVTNNKQNNNLQTFDFSQSIMSSISSILLIGGVVCFAFVILEVVTSSKFFLSIINLFQTAGLDGNLITGIFCGLIEITKGCLMLSTIPIGTKLATMIVCFVISFGGISTFLQSYAFLKNIVPAKTFLLQKFTHALCSSLVCSIILLIV